ncbi:hypothetical protein Cch01nite_40510 [Cellulomonas chitinilytica]|uniref:Toprim domain-containing protein n=2 Tax=Cellulomonas chitinilytica TaxID=398759 RepID=A0A919P729_9CELL|nr:hypothetical protein Cch01nite_40510 [Cellulomonas chitinilytica]
MSIHKLTAGSGYDYLTRQVAAQDVTEKGHSSLASYYSAKGEAPGTWIGAGMAGLARMAEGDEVTAEQMRNLFGAGKHPLAEQLRAIASEQGLDANGQEAAASLGTPFRVYANDVSEFRRRLALEVTAFNTARGLPGDTWVPMQARADLRTKVATALFREEFNRDPADARELAAAIAKHSRPRTNAVAGFDLTFSPVKSVSTLWALADKPTAARIEHAHQAAVRDALSYLERNALYTRQGTNGVRQVETRGLIAAAFTHRDSRAGDPDLHTHVAIANKVQTRADGRWLAIDGRILFAATVAASETYNTALERHLGDLLGLQFAARPTTDRSKRPVREVVGVDPVLADRWSSRRASIEARRAELATQFQNTHGRPPSPIESIQLAQQATLETREAKHEPRSLDEQRLAWAREARQVLGSDEAVELMTAHALHRADARPERVDAAWVRQAARAVLDALQVRRSHWKRWHVEAEALRRIRGTDVRTEDVENVVSLVVDEVLTRHSVPLTTSGDELTIGRPGAPAAAARRYADEPAGAASLLPAALRRSDGASVYTVAGAQLFTSPELLTAEARIVDHASHFDGPKASPAAVEAAFAQSAEAGLPLNAGQATLVREMASSGARLQLAIAPAGAGKTTAMRALVAAWRHDGGDVVGLAPSAAAAAVLGDSTGAASDTMAKLLHDLEQSGERLSSWAKDVDECTLIIVDEAGMADTLSLDRLLTFVAERGASVRLIGDDQQLSAIGAGGVLRDIRSTHGCLQLSELMRFSDPAEAAASLALRDGLPESIGFYLDNERVHVGDVHTLIDEVFDAWAADRAAGRNSIMLAPTRELVGELNRRAHAHALEGTAPTTWTTLSDGNATSVGDTIITRTNDRRLRLTASDWVKNGDRWTITDIRLDGSVTAQHLAHGMRITLPPDYVSKSVELGYASTIHAAQGLTADAGHTLLTGQESRQLVYTAATRGKGANHLYLQLVDDGDEHNVIRPEHLHPLTATDVLERILANDGAARSASTMARDEIDPAVQLGDAAARYADSLYVGAEQLVGADALSRLDAQADTIQPNLTDAAAWPTLRAHLVLLGAVGVDPVAALRHAASRRELNSALDVAAVIDWRLDDTGLRNAGPGPLPWLPAIPEQLALDEEWGPYLAARAARVRDLAAQVVDQAVTDVSAPAWARNGQHRPGNDLLADVAVWRAANQVPVTDHRPTGAPQLATALARWQHRLDRRLARAHTPALKEWAPLLSSMISTADRDPFVPVLAERLAALTRAGIDAALHLRSAYAQGTLPDDHAAAALWWRMSERLAPAVAAQVTSNHTLVAPWTSRLDRLVGADQATTIQHSPWWPALITAVERAAARGAAVESLFTGAAFSEHDDVDPCQAWVWRISLLDEGPPSADVDVVMPVDGPDTANVPTLPWGDAEGTHVATFEAADAAVLPGEEPPTYEDEPSDEHSEHELGDATAEAVLTIAALARRNAGVLAPTDQQITADATREFDAAMGPVSGARILELNQLARDFYASRFGGSWAQNYLASRLGVDLAGDPHVQPGYAPGGWTTLVDHLRRLGATDLELRESGLASVARNGRLIDRFRDRLVLPITRLSDGELLPLGFVGRRHPRLDDSTARDRAPKYLNTPDTALFHKGAQLYGVRSDLLSSGGRPVIVEGPLDAIAAALADPGHLVGLAPLGTSLTETQAAWLAQVAHETGTRPLVATDADLAGSRAAQRAFWLLAQHAVALDSASMRLGSDPAELLQTDGAEGLRAALTRSAPFAESLLDERLKNLSGSSATRAAVTVLAADAPETWTDGSRRIAAAVGTDITGVRRALADAVTLWEADPRRVAIGQIAEISAVHGGAGGVTPTASVLSEADARQTPASPSGTPARGARSTPPR